MEARRQRMKLYTKRVICLCVLIAHIIAETYIPVSFSINHDEQLLDTMSPRSIISAVKKFQVDSHISIVLVGNGLDDTKVSKIQGNLDILTGLYSSCSPLDNIYQKLIFHVTYSSSLTIAYEKVLHANLNVEIEVSTLDAVFQGQNVVGITLYVLLSNNNRLHRIKSRVKYTQCKQQSYISKKSSYAWIDISALGDSVCTSDDWVETVRRMMYAVDDPIDIVSAMIYRSTESMIPLPYHTTRQRDSSDIDISIDYVKIVVVNICVERGICKVDRSTMFAIDKVIKNISNFPKSTDSEVISLSALEQPQLLHALMSARDELDDGSVAYNTAILLQWLARAELVENLLVKHSQSIHNNNQTNLNIAYLPVFVVQSTGGTHRVTKVLEFPKRAAKLQVSTVHSNMHSTIRKSTSAVEESVWPRMSVVIVRAPWATTGPRDPDEGTPVITCSGLPVSIDENFEIDLTLHAVLEAVWGLYPAHIHYSSTSNSLVGDFMWNSFYFGFSGNSFNSADAGQLTFRERNLIPRHYVMHKADYLNHLLVSGVSQLLDLSINLANLPKTLLGSIVNDDTTQLTGHSAPKATKLKVSQHKYQASNNLTQFFLLMDEAASCFSLEDFHCAARYLGQAETLVLAITQSIDSVIELEAKQLEVDCLSAQQPEQESKTKTATHDYQVANGNGSDVLINVIIFGFIAMIVYLLTNSSQLQ